MGMTAVDFGPRPDQGVARESRVTSGMGMKRARKLCRKIAR